MNYKISVLILTKNEQQDIQACLESVAWSDDIHVYDSYSSDKTVEIARSFGATITQRHFDNWASHQNWGLQNINFKYDWVYYSDADERVTFELKEEIRRAVNKPNGNVAFRVRRRDYLFGTWLKHVTPSPFNIRLFRPGFIRYERAVNPKTVVLGDIGDIDAHFDHYSFSKGFDHWLDKHNRYSALEAQQILSNIKSRTGFSLKKAFFNEDKNERRYHQKELFYRLPFRPLIKFLLLYIIKCGFLDGRAGFTYAMLQSIYEYFIVLKTRELLHLQQNE